MQIAFHIGANCTDEDRLLKSALRNASALSQQGIVVPGPSRYRSLLRDTIQSLGTRQPEPDTREILLDAIVENDGAERLLLANDNFIAVPKRIFDHGVFYGQADTKLRAFRRIFAQDQIMFYLSIRNPVTFLQETLRRTPNPDLQTFLNLMTPDEVRWSDVVRRIKQAVPDCPLVVWCIEDSPLLWEDLIRVFTGIDDESPVHGAMDMLAPLITKDGLEALTARLATERPAFPVDRHEIIAEALETHALPDEMEDEIDLPGLSADEIDAMTDRYEADLVNIAGMQGVHLMLPFDESLG